MQTIKQFVASVRACKNCPTDMQHQTNAWPYPQASQSHITFWRQSWQTDLSVLPDRQVHVMLDGSDIPGALMTIRRGEMKPREVVAELLTD